ncbi:MAG: ABC transporter substrate-binding protein [Fusobacterium perfoetens]|uniref:ABC transporter substrate-binding protein n=1 Tax=Fusobacterium perfoetens TaxID=852 RepID=UPI0023F30483|nr:ABC transporter substrate-binding protein [Fusobacterium perfoetens]MCI6153143.1 ABC transporter substrate-binding protein [Fusobacterium perfoetens]MDY3237073.1 ABC transporter substrate-binding protein [Fusobacterium perfoetens]
MKKKLGVVLGFLLIKIFSFSLEIKENTVYGYQNNNIPLKKYNRVVVTDPAVIETMYMLNAQNKIVGIAGTKNSKIWPYEETKKLLTVGNTAKPSLEKIIALQPDLVIVNGMSIGLADSLKSKNIPVLINDGTKDFKNILESIRIFGKLFDREKESENLYKESKEKLKILEERKKLKEIKGVILYSTNPMMGFSKESLPGQVLELIGVKNITDGLIGERPIISPEYLLSENPQIIMGAMSISSIKNIEEANPFIKNTIAGKNNNIFIVDSSKILRGSPRIFDTMEELKKEIENAKI